MTDQERVEFRKRFQAFISQSLKNDLDYHLKFQREQRELAHERVRQAAPGGSGDGLRGDQG